MVSAYFDILLESVIPAALTELIQYCEFHRKEVIIGCDTNAHSTLWHCPETNARGERLEEWILLHNLRVHNNGSEPTFHRAGARTIIDMTLTRGTAIGAEVTDWEVTDAVMGSDHQLLQWRIPISTIYNNGRIRNWNKGDWLSFQICLEEVSEHRQMMTQRDWSVDYLDAATREFEQDITDCLDQSHPKFRSKARVHGLVHFDSEMTRWKKKVRACQSNYRKHNTETAWEQFRDARRKLKSLIKKAKKSAWREFCEEADNPSAVSKVNKVIQGRTSQTLGLMKRSDGTLLPSPEISLIHVINTHFPGNRMRLPDLNSPLDTVNIYSREAEFLHEQAAAESIQAFGAKKAAGPDELPPCVFQHFGEATIRRLVKLFKASYLLGYVPEQWRNGKVIFIPKPGKSDYATPRSFRPITLSSFMIKVMERIVLWHLNNAYF